MKIINIGKTNAYRNIFGKSEEMILGDIRVVGKIILKLILK
jgi:hypothetical protein